MRSAGRNEMRAAVEGDAGDEAEDRLLGGTFVPRGQGIGLGWCLGAVAPEAKNKKERKGAAQIALTSAIYPKRRAARKLMGRIFAHLWLSYTILPPRWIACTCENETAVHQRLHPLANTNDGKFPPSSVLDGLKLLFHDLAGIKLGGKSEVEIP